MDDSKFVNLQRGTGQPRPPTLEKNSSAAASRGTSKTSASAQLTAIAIVCAVIAAYGVYAIGRWL